MGDLSEYPKLKGRDAEAVRKFQEQIELRQKAAENVPKESFDIALRVFVKEEKDLKVKLVLESRYEYIGASASGSKKKMRKFRKWEKALWQYYGVTQEDIDKKTERY